MIFFFSTGNVTKTTGGVGKSRTLATSLQTLHPGWYSSWFFSFFVFWDVFLPRGICFLMYKFLLCFCAKWEPRNENIYFRGLIFILFFHFHSWTFKVCAVNSVQHIFNSYRLFRRQRSHFFLHFFWRKHLKVVASAHLPWIPW